MNAASKIAMSAGIFTALAAGWIGAISFLNSPHVVVVDELVTPISVSGYTESGVVLSSGTVIAVPGFPHLPTASRLMDLMVSSGVEVDRGGRIYGLMPVNHGCGLDVVKTHVARVDIGMVLEFAEITKIRGYDIELLAGPRGLDAATFHRYAEWLRKNYGPGDAE